MSSQDQPEDNQHDDAATADDAESDTEEAPQGDDSSGGADQAEGDDSARADHDGDSGPTQGGGQADADGESGEDDDGGGGQAEAEQKPPTEEERLEQLDERIDKARSQAEEAGILEGEDATADDERQEPETDDHGEREFAESGATENEDDQTIAPPG